MKLQLLKYFSKNTGYMKTKAFSGAKEFIKPCSLQISISSLTEN